MPFRRTSNVATEVADPRGKVAAEAEGWENPASIDSAIACLLQRGARMFDKWAPTLGALAQRLMSDARA